MNSTFQLDSHPDAESLNAFAEQALPEREHGQVLAHLAACSRCRQVVFLAQQAATEFEMQAAAASRPEFDQAAAYGFAAAMAPAPLAAAEVATGRDVGKEQTWWSGGWRLAWVPAVALAAIIGLVVFVHVRDARLVSESGSESRLVVPQSPAQTQPKAAEFQPAAKTAMEKAQLAASPNAKVPKEKILTALASAPVEAFSAQAAPPAPSAMEMSSAELNRTRPLQQPQGHGTGMQLSEALLPQSAPAAATPRPQLAAGTNSFNDTSAGASSAKFHGAVSQAQASQSVSVSAMAPQSALEPASIGSLISDQQISEPRAEAMAALKAKITMLPSGLRAVSIVTAQHRTLAIDSSGMLFLSEDSGVHWESVARQWSGRAVAVRIQDGLNINSKAEAKAAVAENASSNSNIDAVSASTAPPVVFEIVNDSDLVWVSTDGKNWKQK